MSVLCVIPARAGSRRLPGKNMRQLGDMPLVGWSMLVAAAASPYLDGIIVSSDDDAVLSYVSHFSGFTALRRPAELATDKADSYCVLKHAYFSTGRTFDHILLLQPTSPLRTPHDVVRCLGMAETTEWPAVVSYAEGADVPNGAVYVGRSEWLIEGGNFDAPCHAIYRMPPERSVDIDTLEDFQRAEQHVADVIRRLVA